MFSRVLIARDKLIGYLLNLNHERGASKANFFINICGFSPGNPQELEDELRMHPLTATPHRTIQTIHGVKYTFICEIQTPASGPTCIRSIWQIDKGGNGTPRLINALP